MLATCAYLTGRDDEYLDALERAHRGYAEEGKNRNAVRCAFWLGLRLLFRGEAGRANGWLSRARRLLGSEPADCAEQGYLLLPLAEQQIRSGDCAGAYATAQRATEIGDRCADADLSACARHLQGRVLIQQGELDRGLALLDEAMLAVSSGNLSPIMTGLTYCSVIDACQSVYALGRAREWTAALAAWCELQPEMVAFSGVCLAHRAEIMQLHGAWDEALGEARRACERCALGGNREAAAAAFYRQAEVHRLRGELAAAEAAYRKASQSGRDPLPGLALLRVAQGRPDAAAAAMRRAIRATSDRLERARLLPGHVEIMLALEALEEARAACGELEALARDLRAGMVQAMAAQARGALHLAEGDAAAALPSLREAWRTWQEVQAPYHAARVRVLIGSACRALGDADGAELETEAARKVFADLGAALDLRHIESLAGSGGEAHAHPLTARELQVLRLVAAGKTNKAIAAELALSEKTVHRHVSNIFDKLDVGSRTAAAAYVYRHKLTG
jgi:DNA-binding NarL/FixJ family response regulator